MARLISLGSDPIRHYPRARVLGAGSAISRNMILSRSSTFLPKTSHHAPRNSALGYQTDKNQRSAGSVGPGLRLLPK
jgi:hypothetical protein